MIFVDLFVKTKHRQDTMAPDVSMVTANSVQRQVQYSYNEGKYSRDLLFGCCLWVVVFVNNYFCTASP